MIYIENVVKNNISKIKSEKPSSNRVKTSKNNTSSQSRIESPDQFSQINNISSIEKSQSISLSFDIEYILLSQKSSYIFDFLKQLRIYIIDDQIDRHAIEEIKNKILKNKHKYTNKFISDLAEDILLRLEIEIAKLEALE